MSYNKPSLYKAYNNASHTVAKTRQVVMLYDGAIRFLQQAAEAIEKKDIEQRYNKLTRASEVIMGLQSCLDFEAGAQTAQILYDFYASIDLRILGLHRRNEVKECEDIIAALKQMRDVWDTIDRGDNAVTSKQQVKPATSDAAPISA